jgi:hypothetical protein
MLSPKLYPLAGHGSVVLSIPGVKVRDHRMLRAINTGVKRCPKEGEWYLSGAIVEAYRAPNDLGITYNIARIVEVVERKTYEIVDDNVTL